VFARFDGGGSDVSVVVGRCRVGTPGVVANLVGLAAGTLSFSKVRALCRYADPATEAALVDMADSATAAMLERMLRAFDRAVNARTAEDLAALAHRRRGLRIGYVGDDGTVSIRIVTTQEGAAALRTRLDEYETLVPNECVEGANDPRAARAHDAFERLVTGPEPAQVVVNIHAQLADIESTMAGGIASTPSADDKVADTEAGVTEESLEGSSTTKWAGAVAATPGDSPFSSHQRSLPTPGERESCSPEWSAPRFGFGGASAEALLTPKLISPAIAALLARIGCDARARFVIDDHDAIIDLGRTCREPSRRLRRYILRRDAHCCRFVGCDHRAEHIHHVRRWCDGGPTDRDNLAAVCRWHHRLVHEGGWWITGNPEKPDGLRFHSPDRGEIGGERLEPMAPSTTDAARYLHDPTGHGVDTRHYYGPMNLSDAVAGLVSLLLPREQSSQRNAA
jgi:Domain of unknown function (DUF222)